MDDLLSDEVLGIDAHQFIIDHVAELSAKSTTDRLLLIRILSKIENVSTSSLLDETFKMDAENLERLLNDQPKFIK